MLRATGPVLLLVSAVPAAETLVHADVSGGGSAFGPRVTVDRGRVTGDAAASFRFYAQRLLDRRRDFCLGMNVHWRRRGEEREAIRWCGWKIGEDRSVRALASYGCRRRTVSSWGVARQSVRRIEYAFADGTRKRGSLYPTPAGINFRGQLHLLIVNTDAAPTTMRAINREGKTLDRKKFVRWGDCAA